MTTVQLAAGPNVNITQNISHEGILAPNLSGVRDVVTQAYAMNSRLGCFNNPNVFGSDAETAVRRTMARVEGLAVGDETHYQEVDGPSHIRIHRIGEAYCLRAWGGRQELESRSYEVFNRIDEDIAEALGLELGVSQIVVTAEQTHSGLMVFDSVGFLATLANAGFTVNTRWNRFKLRAGVDLGRQIPTKALGHYIEITGATTEDRGFRETLSLIWRNEVPLRTTGAHNTLVSTKIVMDARRAGCDAWFRDVAETKREIMQRVEDGMRQMVK